MRDRTIQILSVLVAVAALFVAGTLLPRIVAASDDGKLRYTNVSVEGAPPIVAIRAGAGPCFYLEFRWWRWSCFNFASSSHSGREPSASARTHGGQMNAFDIPKQSAFAGDPAFTASA